MGVAHANSAPSAQRSTSGSISGSKNGSTSGVDRSKSTEARKQHASSAGSDAKAAAKQPKGRSSHFKHTEVETEVGETKTVLVHKDTDGDEEVPF